jgi:hypothetical protein
MSKGATWAEGILWWFALFGTHMVNVRLPRVCLPDDGLMALWLAKEGYAMITSVFNPDAKGVDELEHFFTEKNILALDPGARPSIECTRDDMFVVMADE